jgi:hypothetical protein
MRRLATQSAQTPDFGAMKGENEMRRYGTWAVLALLIAGSAVGTASSRAESITDRWQWLNDTYWYVPPAYLLAIASNPASSAPLPVSDQTAYHIDHYQAGYFWGTTAVVYEQPQASSSQTPSCLQLVGSVTPEGKVHLTFTALPSVPPPAGPAASEPTVGIGTMIPQRGEWTMENQMSTIAVGNVLLTHWAYMFQCKPRERCFATLPGVGVSVPEFLGPCLTTPPS